LSFEVVQIDIEQAERLKGLSEGMYCDLKARGVKPAKLSQTLSALANKYGGEVYLGIAEDDDKADGVRTWDGFPSLEAANGHLQAIEQCFPLGQNITCTFLECESEPGFVLKIEVEKTTHVVESTDGTPYARFGAQSFPISTREARERLEMAKGLKSQEDRTVNTPASVITNSETILGFLVEVVPSAEPDDWLESQRLIREGLPTVGGILLFSDAPQADLPKTAIKLYRYRTTADEGSRESLEADPIVIEGNTVRQIHEAVEATVRMVQSTPALGNDGLEDVRYPQVAVHEIVTNAVLHRDYSIQADIHIRVFDNRVEVESPGPLPGHITVENILSEQLARNPKIVRMAYKFPDRPNKDVGEGLNTAFQALHELNLKEPVIEDLENSVRVTILHERLASPEEAVLAYLEEHQSINNSIGRGICYITSENVMKRVFERLMRAGQIERIPELRGRNAAYRLAAPPVAPVEVTVRTEATADAPESGQGCLF